MDDFFIKYADFMRAFSLVSVCLLFGLCLAQKATAPSSADRKLILEAIRPKAEKAIGMKIKFSVRTLRMVKNFAYIYAQPMKADGSEIDWSETKFAQDYADGVFDAGVMALLKKSGKVWKVLEWDLGATDFPGEEWCKKHHAPLSVVH